MEAGDPRHLVSPIVQAIAQAEKHTTGEIRVHLSRSRWERNIVRSAERVFHKNAMDRTSQRNGILLYINLRKHRFAIHGDEGIHKAVGQKYWDELATQLREDLQSTHFERAIALAVITIGVTLQRFFPSQQGRENPDELTNEVTHD